MATSLSRGTSARLAHQLRELMLEGTWIAGTNFRDQVSCIPWEKAACQAGSAHSVADLMRHIHYYLGGVLRVLQGGPLDIRDIYAFDFLPIQSSEEWEEACNRCWKDAQDLVALIEGLPDKNLDGDFSDGRYGSIQHNVDALIAHGYYHLGQIVLLNKHLLS